MGDSKAFLNLKSNFVNSTQLLLNYLCAVGGREEYNKLLKDLDEVVISLYKKNVRSNAFFHGCRVDGIIRGEPISNELWYWISNGFIKQKHESYKVIDNIFESRIFLEFTEKAKGLLSQENIESHINRNLPNEIKGILKDAIDSTIANSSAK